MFVFDLETYNDQEFAESYAASLYDVNRLRNKWGRDLTPDEIVTKKNNVIVFGGSKGNPVMNMLEIFQRTTKEKKEQILIKMGMKELARIYFY